MYGMIHKAARELTLKQFGEEVWLRTLSECGLNDEHFISGQHYGDEITLSLIGAIQSETKIPLEDLLEEFGRFWIEFARASKYGGIFDMAGEDLITFVGNLDRMHDGIRSTMPGANMPSFEMLNFEEGKLELVYRSDRDGLAPFVKGLLDGLMRHFKVSGEVTSHAAEDGVHFFIEIKKMSQVA